MITNILAIVGAFVLMFIAVWWLSEIQKSEDRKFDRRRFGIFWIFVAAGLVVLWIFGPGDCVTES